MKGFKINMDVVNCVLLVVILVLVIVCCVKREGFKAPPVNPGRVGNSQLSVGGQGGGHFSADASGANGGPTLNSGGSAKNYSNFGP